MIEDILFEKLSFPPAASIQMELLPAEHSTLRSSSGRGSVSQAGVLVSHRFSISNQPLKAAEVRELKRIKNSAKKRCVLFRNPFMPSASAAPMANKYGSYSGGALIRPKGAIKWQVVRYFATATQDMLSYHPIAYAENIKLADNTPVTYDFVTKDCSLGREPASREDGTSIVFASFDYWLPCKITQFNVVPYRERRLSLSDDDVEYSASIVLEEDPKVSLPLLYSWPSAEEVGFQTEIQN